MGPYGISILTRRGRRPRALSLPRVREDSVRKQQTASQQEGPHHELNCWLLDPGLSSPHNYEKKWLLFKAPSLEIFCHRSLSQLRCWGMARKGGETLGHSESVCPVTGKSGRRLNKGQGFKTAKGSRDSDRPQVDKRAERHQLHHPAGTALLPTNKPSSWLQLASGSHPWRYDRITWACVKILRPGPQLQRFRVNWSGVGPGY